MKEASKTCTYTAQRASYISTVCALIFLMIAELGLIILLIAKFILIEFIKFGLICVLVALFLNIETRLLAPLWTKHRLTLTSLQLHYGLEFKAEIPRNTIIEARQVRERVALPLARYEAEKERIVAVFSEQGQVLLVLDQAYPFRIGLFGSSKLAKQILINVDQRDEFLADLDLKPDAVRKHRYEVEEPGLGYKENGAGIRAHFNTTQAPWHAENKKYDAYSHLAIRTEHLSRSYHGFTAVDGLNLAIHSGEIYGFLGSNGAGKTTTMKMLVGLLKPDAGRAYIAGHEVWAEPLAAKSAFGYVADHSMLYDRLTGREFLEFLAHIRRIPELETNRRIERLLDILELKDRAETACSTYSFGMKRKLAIAGALIHKPAVLILDEPLNGLDPLSAHRLKDLFSELAVNGTTIFLSTHDLSSAESLCHRVGIIHKGRLLVEGSASELRQLAGAPGLEEAFLSLTSQQTEVPI